MTDIIESFEFQSGAAIDMQYRPEQNRACPIKIDLLDEDDQEYQLFISNDDFTKFCGVLIKFGKRVLEFRKAEMEGDRT